MGGGKKRKAKEQPKEIELPEGKGDNLKAAKEELLDETSDRIIGNGMNHELDDIPNREHLSNNLDEQSEYTTERLDISGIQKYSINGVEEESEQSLTNVDLTRDSLPTQNEIKSFTQNGH